MKRGSDPGDRPYDPMPTFTLKSLLEECEQLAAQADYAVKATLHGADRAGQIPPFPGFRGSSCASDICAVYHYAFNGAWAESLELTLAWDTVESLQRLTEIAEIALLGRNHRASTLLDRLNLVTVARARIDLPLSGHDRRFQIHPADLDPLGYDDIALLSGISKASLRNLVSNKSVPLTPQKAGKNAWFDASEAQAWLIKDRQYEKTRLVPDKNFWGGIERLLADSNREFN